MLGAWYCHGPSATFFRLLGAMGPWLCGDAGGAWVVWPAAECARVE